MVFPLVIDSCGVALRMQQGRGRNILEWAEKTAAETKPADSAPRCRLCRRDFGMIPVMAACRNDIAITQRAKGAL
jgi:hypothetical protein